MKIKKIEIRISKIQSETNRYFRIRSNCPNSDYRVITYFGSEEHIIENIKLEIRSTLSDLSLKLDDQFYSYEIKFVFNQEESIEARARFGDTKGQNFKHFEYPKWQKKISEEEQKLFFIAIHQLTDNNI